MRPRTELAVGLGLLALVGIGVGALGSRRASGTAEATPRRSTFRSDPEGAQGLAEALPRLGVRVEHFRQRPALLPRLIRGDSLGPLLLAVLGPSVPLTPPEAGDLVAFTRVGDLLLAGPAAGLAMECFGFRPALREGDSARAIRPGERVSSQNPWVRAVLVRIGGQDRNDGAVQGGDEDGCQPRRVAQFDTLLITPAGRLVAVRFRSPSSRHLVTLIADDRLVSNRSVRDTEAGPFLLGLLAEGHGRVVFDEYHHGFSAGGSLAGAVLAWSLRSPWGWALWQLAVVGLLVLLVNAVRFGPPTLEISRKRRSPIEHVQALAGALGAARGWETAIGAMVRGLQRRLSPSRRAARGDWRGWLVAVDAGTLRSPAREAAQRLRRLSQSPADEQSVMAAANAVEDLWEELRP
jgi:hypothetical protein